MNSTDKKSNQEKIDELVELVGKYSLLENEETEEAVSLCREIGNPACEALVSLMGRDIMTRLDSDNSHRSDNAAFVLGKVGKMSIPALSSALHLSSHTHWALGIVARLEENEDAKTEALAILRGELLSSDWMRVEAAVKGLGITKDKSIIPALEKLQSTTSSFEVMRACINAIEKLS